MKVTAIIDDQLIADVKELTQGANVTDAIAKALREWLDMRRVRALNAEIAKEPLELADAGFIRETNRAR
jgi:hypothetical protein